MKIRTGNLLLQSTNYCKSERKTIAAALKVPFQARQPFSQTASQPFTQPAATGKFPAVITGRARAAERGSELADEAKVASCGLQQTHQMTDNRHAR